MGAIEYSAFLNALKQLETSLAFLKSPIAESEEGLLNVLQAGAIQAFEFTYELAVKMLRRQLSLVVPVPAELKAMDYMDLVRTAAQAGLVRNVADYYEFRELRNHTSHTYDAGRARQVLSAMDRFTSEMQFLLAELKRRNDG